jgi:hypothetical protein
LRAIKAITAMQTRWSGTSQEARVAFFLANMRRLWSTSPRTD